MQDLAIGRAEARGTPGVEADARGGHHGERDERSDRHAARGSLAGAEELAVALDASADADVVARFEQANGEPRIRIIDVRRGETLAVLTPEELRALTEQTGLPPGMFVHTAS